MPNWLQPAPGQPRRPARPSGFTTLRRTPPSPRRRVAARWAAVLAVLLCFAVLWSTHPYYQRIMFEPWHPFWMTGLALWLLGGMAYVRLTLQRFGGPRMDLSDGAMFYLAWGRGLWWWARRQARWPSHVTRNRRFKLTLLSLGVKVFFTPLMTVFVVGHAGNLSAIWMKTVGLKVPKPEEMQQLWRQGIGPVWDWLQGLIPKLLPTAEHVDHALSPWSWGKRDFWWLSDVFYQLIFLVDCLWALTGYALESRWLNNKTRSVEPTALGWFVALMCYPPFNDLSGSLIPLGRGPVLFDNEWALILCRIILLAAFTVYVWATVAFGPTFSNLTNRGIITRGPYRYIRHPAYAAKNLAWWMEHLPYLSWSSALGLVAWNTVYAMRAWTEERHLEKDPAYRAYREKVRWAFIPGVF